MTFALALVMNVPKIAQSYLTGSVALGAGDMLGAGAAAGLGAGAVVGALKGATAATQALADVAKKALGFPGAGSAGGQAANAANLARNTVASGLTQNLGTEAKQRGGQRDVTSTGSNGRSSSATRADQGAQRQSASPSRTSERSASRSDSPSGTDAPSRSDAKRSDGEQSTTRSEQQQQQPPEEAMGRADAESAAQSNVGAGEIADAMRTDHAEVAESESAFEPAAPSAEAAQLARSEAMLASISENLEAAAESGRYARDRELRERTRCHWEAGVRQRYRPEPQRIDRRARDAQLKSPR